MGVDRLKREAAPGAAALILGLATIYLGNADGSSAKQVEELQFYVSL